VSVSVVEAAVVCVNGGVSAHQSRVVHLAEINDMALLTDWILPSKLARWQDRICTKH